MEPTQMSNFETVCNMCANLCELIGIKSGAAFLIAGILLLFTPKKKDAFKLIIGGFIVLAAGLAAPGLVNWTYPAFAPGGMLPEIVGTAIFGTTLLLVGVFGIATFFVPAVICRHRGAKFTTMMAVLSWIGIAVPLTLAVAIYLALKADTGEANFESFKSDVTQKGEEI